MGMSYAVASIARFQCNPRLGSWKYAQKVSGYLKKHLSKGFLLDSRDPLIKGKHDAVKAEFGHQHADEKEEIDDGCPTPLMPEIKLISW